MSKRWKNRRRSSDSWVYEGFRESRRTVNKRVGRHRHQRAEQGYSWHDWINFDTFIAGVIANAARDFRLNGVGYPGNVTQDEWTDILARIETPLRAWSEGKHDAVGSAERGTLYRECQEALRLFADHFGSFWD